GRPRAQALRGERHALRMVSRGGADHAARERSGLEVRHLVVRAAQLEREHRLLVLALEEHVVAQAPRDGGGALERALDRDVVHLRREDRLEVSFGLHPESLRTLKHKASRRDRCGMLRRWTPTRSSRPPPRRLSPTWRTTPSSASEPAP